MSDDTDKATFEAAFEQRAAGHMVRPSWSERDKLALTCRMLADDGHESGVAGQITCRASEPGSIWTLHFGLGFDEAESRSFIRVGQDLQTLEGEGTPNPATRFHLWVYRERPDVQCIVHTHPPAISALSMIGRPLAVAHMDATLFHNDCAWLETWPGLPIADDEGRIISSALGQKHAILLAHHGQLCAGKSIEQAAVMALMIERVARVQLAASAVAPVRPVDPAKAQEAHDFLHKPLVMNTTFDYYARRVIRGAPETISSGADA